MPRRRLLRILSMFMMLSVPAVWARDLPQPGSLAYKAAHVTPHPRQLVWQQREYIAFIHYTVNAFTDKEWGDGTEDPAIFNPGMRNLFVEAGKELARRPVRPIRTKLAMSQASGGSAGCGSTHCTPCTTSPASVATVQALRAGA